MEKKINIKIVADIVCPWCFIGCNHLNASLKSRNFYKYEIDWQPFYLNPTMPSNGIDRKQYLKNKFGSQVNLIESQILNAAENYNIKINLEKINTTPNTRKIHSAISIIKKYSLNKSYDFAFKIMTDYFANGKDLNFDCINGVPVFIYNDKWTLNGAQAPKVIETIIDIAAKD